MKEEEASGGVKRIEESSGRGVGLGSGAVQCCCSYLLASELRQALLQPLLSADGLTKEAGSGRGRGERRQRALAGARTSISKSLPHSSQGTGQRAHPSGPYTSPARPPLPTFRTNPLKKKQKVRISSSEV